MTEVNQINDLIVELIDSELEVNDNLKTIKVSDRGCEIINEICDYAEQTTIFQENKEKTEIFNGSSAYQVYGYMLNRIVSAPIFLYAQTSVLLIMPVVRQKLIAEGVMVKSEKESVNE